MGLLDKFRKSEEQKEVESKIEKMIRTKTVEEGYPRDRGSKTVRMELELMDKLNLCVNDVVEIKGKKTTVAKCSGLFSKDENERIIRMNDYVRLNAGLEIGDKIYGYSTVFEREPDDVFTIQKIRTKDVSAIIVQPIEKYELMDTRFLSSALEGEVFKKEDKFNIRNQLFEVTHIYPYDAVKITEETRFIINDNIDRILDSKD